MKWLFFSVKRIIKEERRLALENDGTIDSEGRVQIKGSYDGNWAKRSYRYTYNSLVGAGCLIGYYTGLPLWFAVKNKDCGICASETRRGKKSKKHQQQDHNCFKNWDNEKSAKAMEPSIAVEICLELSKHGVMVKTIIGDEDASTLKQIRDLLPSPLNEVEKESDLNHIKRNLTTKISKLKAEKYSDPKFKLSMANILHMVTNFGWALKTHQNKPKEAAMAIQNVIPHSFGDHTKCGTIGNGEWCKNNDLNYKPGFKGGKYLGHGLDPIQKKQIQNDLEIIFAEMTTEEMMEKLAPCGSSQRNESLHSMVISFASKSLHFGRSNSYLGCYSMAILKMFKDNSIRQLLLDKLGMNIGYHTEEMEKKQNNSKRKQAERKKRPESKLQRNKLKKQRSAKNSKAEKKEDPQYESGMGINKLEQSDGKKRKRSSEEIQSKKRLKDTEKTDTEYPFQCSVIGCTKKYKQKGFLRNHIESKHK